jgi:nitrate/nitrite-specific signal transduction histidine kinase
MFTKKPQMTFGPVARFFAATAMLATPAFAQSATALVDAGSDTVDVQFVQEDGGSARINFAGKLRMLSQRIPAAACNLNAGIAPAESEAVLNGAVAEFDRILAGLEFGDDKLGIFGPEERRKTQRIIEELHIKLDPLEAALEDTRDGAPTDAAIQIVADGNLEVLGVAVMLVAQLAGQYANQAELLQSDAITIDIAGRQRMLTQKVSKEVCLIMSDVNADAARETIGGTINVFESSLDALRNGNQAVGIMPPRSEEISAGLDEVYANWMAIKDHLDAMQAGGTIDDEARAVVFLGLNKTMAEMNRVVGLYSDQSKLDL